EKVFRIIGLTDERARQMFGHLLEAFEFGTPPHGGIASGVDRLAMVLAGESSLREVIAFPKTSSGAELMTGAPAPVDEEELEPLHIRLDLPEPATTQPERARVQIRGSEAGLPRPRAANPRVVGSGPRLREAGREEPRQAALVVCRRAYHGQQ